MPRHPLSRMLDIGPVVQEMVPIASDAKIRVSEKQAEGLDWFKPGLCFGILERTGRIRLASGAHESAILAERDRLRDDAQFERLRLLGDAYRPLTIESDRRIDVSTLLFHLDLSIDRRALKDGVVSPQVVVIRFPESIEFWSMAFRNEQLTLRESLLPDLP
jgi:hypothetical protein